MPRDLATFEVVDKFQHPYKFTREQVEAAREARPADAFAAWLWLMQQPQRCPTCGRTCRCAR